MSSFFQDSPLQFCTDKFKYNEHPQISVQTLNTYTMDIQTADWQVVLCGPRPNS